MPKPRISFMFPAHNEEDNIVHSVEIASKVMEDVASEYEIIVVDDGSVDKTASIIDNLALTNPHVRAYHHVKNLGYGDALWTGIQKARYDWFFFTDSDLQFDINEIRKLLSYISEYKIVLGYRAPRKDPFMRILNGKGWNILVRMLFGLKVRDIDCAFKLIDRKILASLPLKTRGATTSAEILIRLMRNGHKWVEVPVSHYPRQRGSPSGAKPKVIIKAFKELIKLYFMGI